MAQKVQVVLVDDLDDGPAAETVSFALDGTAYEIDLSASNAADLREAFAPYVAAARRVTGGPGSRRRGRRASSAAARPADVRTWAAEQGITVGPRGRIPADVMAQYEAAH